MLVFFKVQVEKDKIHDSDVRIVPGSRERDLRRLSELTHDDIFEDIQEIQSIFSHNFLDNTENTSLLNTIGELRRNRGRDGRYSNYLLENQELVFRSSDGQRNQDFFSFAENSSKQFK